ncbi:hypothetical protein E2C01_060726 [Portunus trituberculatus]|uniref:Uncharacterized protein n=1 Tax=Portunus trituberculatus TaxID=210409 RepID=A0A5B7HBC2_PORTR|nr:hypothetical protein [Portunus trituberculatus]
MIEDLLLVPYSTTQHSAGFRLLKGPTSGGLRSFGPFYIVEGTPSIFTVEEGTSITVEEIFDRKVVQSG